MKFHQVLNATQVAYLVGYECARVQSQRGNDTHVDFQLFQEMAKGHDSIDSIGTIRYGFKLTYQRGEHEVTHGYLMVELRTMSHDAIKGEINERLALMRYEVERLASAS